MRFIRFLYHQFCAETVAEHADKPVFTSQAHRFFLAGKHAEHFARIGGDVEAVLKQTAPFAQLVSQRNMLHFIHAIVADRVR